MIGLHPAHGNGKVLLKFSREAPLAHMVKNVSPDGVRIGDAVYSTTLALTAERIIEDWTPKSVDALDAEDFDTLLAEELELVLLGTGDSAVFAPRELVFSFARRGVGLEVMDTAAAARTFNVLAGEGRQVGAILFPVR